MISQPFLKAAPRERRARIKEEEKKARFLFSLLFLEEKGTKTIKKEGKKMESSKILSEWKIHGVGAETKGIMKEVWMENE